ncbi:hypothetical protein D1872_277980 [compost metagenome]
MKSLSFRCSRPFSLARFPCCEKRSSRLTAPYFRSTSADTVAWALPKEINSLSFAVRCDLVSASTSSASSRLVFPWALRPIMRLTLPKESSDSAS